MEFDLIIANPPYGSLGNPIISEAITHLIDNGAASVLMPLSCYKKNELYRHVETFELANPKLFEDAEITGNLCICMLQKKEINKYSWQTLVLESVDSKYRLVYEYNILHFDEYKLYPTQKVYITKDDLDVKTDFIDSSRVFSSSHGAIPSFRKQSDCYKYNTQYNESCINKGILVIKFTSEKAKQNYCKFAYNYETLEERNTHLCGKLMKGLRIVSAAQEYYFFIPQLDWGNIHINQKELWDKGLYDEAVLAEMHLKWNDDETEIISLRPSA